MSEEQASDLYAPPSSSVLTAATRNSYRYDGTHLWVMDGSNLPERCIFTNKLLEENPDLELVRKKISWSSPWLLLLILLNLLVFILVALVVQKKATITFYAERSVLKRQRLNRTIGLLGILSSLALIIGGSIALSNPETTTFLAAVPLVALLVLIASIIFVVRTGSGIRATKHVDGWFRLTGVKQPFLESLEVTS